ncbi:3-deoxy-7-phosphoheptulonate synthase [Portibacter marinus]|uniref:3-deoxy-7-phosphoheptulonate synthase n=1 Tax=Portibacter marinus TaxID=2898660 RepID=UPI001F23ACBC|nr:3-deoxy-7-phosphoheptulonate synthase [Portibacter marinus]
MIIQIAADCEEAQLDRIKSEVQAIGYEGTDIETQFGKYIIAIGKKQFDIRRIGSMEGIKDIHRVSDAYKLVSAKWKVGETKVKIGEDLFIGDGHFQMMAGPCSIESEEQIESTVKHLVNNGIKIMRGGVYKPRSSPYSFRGLGIEGLKLWYQTCREHGIKIVTEVMQVSQIEPMHDYIDIFQVGARNSQNFNLLDELGKVDKPILLKRGISGTMNELLQAAEYIFSNGNERIMLCERGIRTYEGAYRNTMDLNAIAMLKEKTHLPVVADPSHGIGVRRFVPQIALASVMAGADALIVEVHESPEKAFSDGQQTLSYREAEALYENVRKTIKLRGELV